MNTPKSARDLLIEAVDAAYGFDPGIQSIAKRLVDRDQPIAITTLADALRCLARRDMREWRPRDRAGVMFWMFRCEVMDMERSAWEEIAQVIIERAYSREVMDWAM